MKKVSLTIGQIIISCGLLGMWPVMAMAQDWLEATRIGGTGLDSVGGVAVDASSNLFCAGSFTGTITLGTNNYRSQGQDDIFLFKANSTGQVIWAMSLGGELSDLPKGLAVDAQGNSVLAGGFGAAILLGNEWLISRGGQDILLAQWDPSGAVLWRRQAGGSGSDEAKAVALDTQGNVIITGVFNSDQAGFENAVLTNRGVGDMFLAKYDSAGNLLWVQQAGGAGDDFGAAVAADKEGNVYVTGGFQGPAWFGTNEIPSGLGSVFVAKYDPRGELVWVKPVGSEWGTYSTGIAVASDGAVYQSGYFSGTAAFGGVSLESNGFLSDIFLVKFDALGSVLWARRAGGESLDQAAGIMVDSADNVLLTGFYFGNASFGSNTVSGVGKTLFVAQYDAAGNAVWVQQPTSSIDSEGKVIAPGTKGELMLGGDFNGSLMIAGTNLESAGGRDVFLAKLKLPECSSRGLLCPVALRKLSPTSFEITAYVNSGHRFELQATSDFTQWTVLTNFVASTNVLVFLEQVSPPVTRRFYRNVQTCR
jgi:hypothetical protein